MFECVVLLFPDIAQLVERSTVESAVIEWSLVRFRVSGLLDLGQLTFRYGFIKARPLCLAARLAHLVERQPFKLVVVGSSPTVGVVFSRARSILLLSPTPSPPAETLGFGALPFVVFASDPPRGGGMRSRGSVSEWLRSRTRNPMGSARGGSNPLAVAFLVA